MVDSYCIEKGPHSAYRTLPVSLGPNGRAVACRLSTQHHAWCPEAINRSRRPETGNVLYSNGMDRYIETGARGRDGGLFRREGSVSQGRVRPLQGDRSGGWYSDPDDGRPSCLQKADGV
jgi:hypothetical protein